jgi:hypothetical protein
MNTYKITNITNLAHKRDVKFNSVVNLEYVDDRQKKSINIKAGETVYLTVQSLPLSIHRLRIKKLIDVVEVSAAEINKVKAPTKKSPPKPKKKTAPKAKKSTVSKKAEVKNETTSTRTSSRKTTSSKKTVEEK